MYTYIYIEYEWIDCRSYCVLDGNEIKTFGSFFIMILASESHDLITKNIKLALSATNLAGTSIKHIENKTYLIFDQILVRVVPLHS